MKPAIRDWALLFGLAATVVLCSVIVGYAGDVHGIGSVFKGVKEFHLPTIFTGLSITEASEADIRQLCTLRKSPPVGKDAKVFKVQGSDFLGYITALIAVCHEDEGEYDDPSFFTKNNII